MNWNDPAERCALIERVGPEEYNRLHAEETARNMVALVNNWPIITVGSRFGTIFMVQGTGKGFQTEEQARAYADSLEPREG